MWYEKIYNSTDGSHRFCLLPISIIEGNACFAVRVNANKDVIFFHMHVYITLEFKLSEISAVGHSQATASGRKMYVWPRTHPLNLWLPSQPYQPPALNCYSPSWPHAHLPTWARFLFPWLCILLTVSMWLMHSFTNQHTLLGCLLWNREGFKPEINRDKGCGSKPLEATNPPSLGLWTFWGQETMALMFTLYLQCSAWGPYQSTQYIFVGCMEGYLYGMMSR